MIPADPTFGQSIGQASMSDDPNFKNFEVRGGPPRSQGSALPLPPRATGSRGAIATATRSALPWAISATRTASAGTPATFGTSTAIRASSSAAAGRLETLVVVLDELVVPVQVLVSLAATGYRTLLLQGRAPRQFQATLLITQQNLHRDHIAQGDHISHFAHVI